MKCLVSVCQGSVPWLAIRRMISGEARVNLVGIQMLGETMRKKLFGDQNNMELRREKLKDKVIKNELKKFGIKIKVPNLLPSPNISLPPLHGNSIDTHFHKIASDMIYPYLKLINELLTTQLPKRPKHWEIKKGWVRYDGRSGFSHPVEFPIEKIIVFDVETAVFHNNKPLMATALSPSAWYSWCSDLLFQDHYDNQPFTLNDLIPFSNHPHQLVIGHNVSFDRSFLKQQYALDATSTYFLDTMSIHIAIAGFTSLQKVVYKGRKVGKHQINKIKYSSYWKNKDENVNSSGWMKKGCLNSLADVSKFYCPSLAAVDKEARNVFLHGNMNLIKSKLQHLLLYCSSDVLATFRVFQQMWPIFKKKFPHPVTLGGMLEMSISYLTINKNNWNKYLMRSESIFQDIKSETVEILETYAEEALNLIDKNMTNNFSIYEKTKIKKNSNINNKTITDTLNYNNNNNFVNNNKNQIYNKIYEKDLWLWDLDWKLKKVKHTKHKSDKEGWIFPNWYYNLCTVTNKTMKPSKLSLLSRVTPKLLKMTFNGYPLHFCPKHGWGFLKPHPLLIKHGYQFYYENQKLEESGEEKERKFPLKEFLNYCKSLSNSNNNNNKLHIKQKGVKITKVDDYLEDNVKELKLIEKELEGQEEEEEEEGEENEEKEEDDVNKRGFDDVIRGCLFYKLPSIKSSSSNIGTPFSKSFHRFLEMQILRPCYHDNRLENIFKNFSQNSYWKNSRERIRSQLNFPVYKQSSSLQTPASPSSFHVILPRIITCGTVTRRAVEPTWLTASNAYKDRLGSELKSLVEAPDSHVMVGADVDSQELWIASLLGDHKFSGVHGSTCMGWMTLQGNKADSSDMHSRTAKIMGISRDQAKVINYARIYGAGIKFAEELLLQFNPLLTKPEAREKAYNMFINTKGKKIRIEHEDFSKSYYWKGGSESHMFNKLEEIANQDKPKTPILQSEITSTLQPNTVHEDFLTSRVNWVVQSSGVDYLHLLLVSMKWLFGLYHIQGRFCISIHDEVHYLVAAKDAYRAALALQVANLFTRVMFAHKLQFHDLPLTVAFFSSVEIDRCLRKEASDDCITPSNPRGLKHEYGIEKGLSLTMEEIIKRTGGKLNLNINNNNS